MENKDLDSVRATASRQPAGQASPGAVAAPSPPSGDHQAQSPLGALVAEIAADEELAWAWHCNIAVPIMDAAGVSHQVANETAAHLMQHLFGCDITTYEHYKYGKSDAQQYAEFRIEMDRLEDEEIASATEARRVEAENTGSIHDGAVPKEDAETQSQ